MKHVKLFEDFGQMMGSQSPAQLVITGDWDGIIKSRMGDTERDFLDFIHPMTFNVEYLPAGSPVPSGYDTEEPVQDMETIRELIFSGGQDGTPLAPKDYLYMKDDTSGQAQDMRKGILRIFVDPSIDPMKIKRFLEEEVKSFDYENFDRDEVQAIVGDGKAGDFNPAFIDAAMSDKPFPRKLVFQV